MFSAATTSKGLLQKDVFTRQTSFSERSVHLAHPIPDLQPLMGAYLHNVERLEKRAEHMSIKSDLDGDICKSYKEQKSSGNERASLYTINAPSTRSRNDGTSSFSDSIVGVNGVAREGGYSPISSTRSGSRPHFSVQSLGQSRSISGASRSRVLSRAVFDEEPLIKLDDATNTEELVGQRPLHYESTFRMTSDFADGDTRAKRMKRRSTGRLPSDESFTQLYNQLAEANHSTMTLSGVRATSDTSFTLIYNQIAGEIKEQLDLSMMNTQEQARVKNEAKSTKTQSESGQTTPLNMRGPRSSSHIPPLRSLCGEPQTFDVEDKLGVNFSFASPIQRTHESHHGQSSGPMRLHVPDDGDNLSDRPTTASSQDTYQQAQGLFQDFDGTHYTPSIRSNVGSFQAYRDITFDSSSTAEAHQTSMIRALGESNTKTNLIPPPSDGMVFYPAPVPRVLNLPQRISQTPSAALLAKRKTQMLNALPENVRRSAPWLSRDGELGNIEDVEANKTSLAALPPQLRASMFFDQGNGRQNIAICDHSAVKTLDALLDASALAPVGAFTDHPILEEVHQTSYKQWKIAQSSVLPPQTPLLQTNRIGARRTSSDESLNSIQVRCTGSYGNTTHVPAHIEHHNSELVGDRHGTVGKNLSEAAEDGGDNKASKDFRKMLASSERHKDYAELSDGEDEEEPNFAFKTQPTTLLAELETRKRQQKDRGRSAYNAFPNGMHATLLELDDVAQVQKAKRTKKRTALAWEDPSQREADEVAEDNDDDVPLGMLYADKSRTLVERFGEDWGRPLGLLEQRHLEENESLSRRRKRLLGIKPNLMRDDALPLFTDEEHAESESEHEGETLGDRLKRLRAKKTLDKAIGDVVSVPSSSSFSVDLLAQIGLDTESTLNCSQKKVQPHSRSVSQGIVITASALKSPCRSQLLSDKSNADMVGAAEGEAMEETLGQCRARLQEEASGKRGNSRLNLHPHAHTSIKSAQIAIPSGPSTPSRTPPPLRTSHSLADMLSAYPTGKNDAQKLSNDMLLSSLPHGSLLAQQAEKTAARKARMRVSSAELLAAAARPSNQHPGNTQKPTSDNRDQRTDMCKDPSQMYGMWQQSMYAETSSPDLLSPQVRNGNNMNNTLHNGYGSTVQVYNYDTANMHQGKQPQHGLERSLLNSASGSRVDAWRQGIVPS